VTACGPSGQGLALNAALRHARAPLIGNRPYLPVAPSCREYAVAESLFAGLAGEMESDDLRPPHTFATLAAELACNSHLDAVASQVSDHRNCAENQRIRVWCYVRVGCASSASGHHLHVRR
jgi:hypothetical protein